MLFKYMSNKAQQFQQLQISTVSGYHCNNRVLSLFSIKESKYIIHISLKLLSIVVILDHNALNAHMYKNIKSNYVG